MNVVIVLGLFLLLIALLVLLNNWQRKVEEIRREKVAAEMRAAEEHGTSRPLAQHPQIDVEACIGCGSCIAACPEDGVLALVDGVARVVHGARCVGHGLCAEACPVAAVKIGLGDVAARGDVPVLSESLETTVPGIYIAGELGGFSLIRNAVAQGTRAIERIAAGLRAGSARAARRDAIDVLIVGAGPAGLAASLKAVECGLSHATIDQDDIGGTVRKYPRRKLTLTGRLEMPLWGPIRQTQFIKEDLIRLWETIIERHELAISTGVRLLGVKGRRDDFLVETSAGTIAARRVLLALGRRGAPRRLGVPGEESEKVLYQLLDAASYRREHILIVGGGDSAVEAATALASQRRNAVTVSYRRTAFFRLKSRNAQRIERFQRRGRLRVIFESDLVRVDDGDVTLSCRDGGGHRELRLRNDQVFIFAGGEPPYPLLAQIGVRFGGEPVGVVPSGAMAEER